MDEKKPFPGHASEDIQVKLDKKLGPEYISKRVGFGSNRVAYIEGWRAINLANQIFGYNGWSTEVKSVTIDFLDERQGKFSIGCTAIVRVTLDSGTYREDIGYGTVENEKRKSAAFERAKKSAVTDALKRSLRGFGNALGNCLYDKDFLSRIDKVKFDPPDFDEGNLFRPSDEISESSRSNTLENPDPRHMNKRRQFAKVGDNHSNTTPSSISNEVHPENSPQRPTRKAREETNQVGGRTEAEKHIKPEQDELLDDSLMFSDDFQDEDIINMERRDPMQGVPKGPPQDNNTSTQENVIEPITFVTAGAASSLQNKSPVPQENVFDPKYQAQSIRHTIDQTTSKHVPATVLKEKGIDGSRDSVYQKFAAKGKQIGATNVGSNNNETDSSDPALTSAPVSTPIHSPSLPVLSRFAPQTTVVHPNTPTAIPTPPKIARREVGRPKFNPLFPT